MPVVEIVDGYSGECLNEARQLFSEYTASLEIDSEFQSVDKVLATLPGRYRPPRGCFLLACWNEHAVGLCGAEAIRRRDL